VYNINANPLTENNGYIKHAAWSCDEITGMVGIFNNGVTISYLNIGASGANEEKTRINDKSNPWVKY
jgi:hypothetical protein